MATTQNPVTATANEITDNLLALGLEFTFLGVAIIVAGISDETGKLTAIFMFGLLMVFMVAHPQVFSRFSAFVSSIGKTAQ